MHFTPGARTAWHTHTLGQSNGNRKVFPGSKTSRRRRAFPRRKAVGKTVMRANRTSPRIFGVRRGRVRYAAVTSPKTIAKRRTLVAYLRYAGLASTPKANASDESHASLSRVPH